MKASRLTWAPLFGVALLAALLKPAQAQPPLPVFDFDTGSAPVQIIIPDVIPVIFTTVNPGDAPLVLRTTTLLTNAWFDAIAPYGETSVGVYSRLGRRPHAERSDSNRNVAILYASYHVLNSLYPEYNDIWRDHLTRVGLDPDDDSANLSSAIGIGNTAGKAVVAARERDGMNQLGDEPGRSLSKRHYNTMPYADYTGFEPANTAYRLSDPSKWQPAVSTSGYGIFKVQQYVTPQLALTRPYSYTTPKRFRAPRPEASDARNKRLYKMQADAALKASANMTDEQKMLAELFDNKINSLGFSALFASVAKELSLEEFVWYDFLTNAAAFDTGIAIWQEKTRYNAVRPFSAIAHIYKKRSITAWGGPYQGVVSDLPADQWQSYLPVADHPEYPSGSAAFCAAHAESSRRFLGTDELNWSFPVPQGSSTIEPGLTPRNDLSISFATWTEFEETCGQSRFWAGVHFPASIPAGADIGREVGALAYAFLREHIEGVAKPLHPLRPGGPPGKRR